MKTEIGSDINKARQLLCEGETVAIPTETVYGLAAHGLDAEAIARIFQAKNRPTFDPLILHIGSIEQLETIAREIPEKAHQLAREFWPGPLTIVLKKNTVVPDLATSGMKTVGIRMPRHPMTAQLLQEIDFPLAAPSANPFGYISPTSAEHVYKQMSGRIPYILDGGTCTVGLESTIIDLSTESPKVLRKGGISVEKIEALIGPLEVLEKSSSNPRAPGMLESHYAPKIPLILGNIPFLAEKNSYKEIRVLGFKSTYGYDGYALSTSGDLTEAAKNLFSTMRKLDAEKADMILAELVPDEGLGKAINDRLKRAAQSVSY
mgnify:CR=1 FL=1